MKLVVSGVRRPAQLERFERSLGLQDSADPSEAKVFRAHAPPQGPCDNLMCALKMPATLQAGGDKLMDTIFEGFASFFFVAAVPLPHESKQANGGDLSSGCS